MSKSLNLFPFESINHYLKALIIIKRIYCHTKKNLHQTYNCICDLVQNITFSEFNTFISLILTYPNKYYINIIADFSEFNQILIAYSLEKATQSDTVISPATKCIFCNDTCAVDWFDFKPALFGRDPILYRVDGLGKKITY